MGLLFAVVILLILRYRGGLIENVVKIGWLGVLGGVLLAVSGIAHMQAMDTTTIANAMVVLGAIPFFTALFARILLKEKLRQSTMMVAAVGLSVMVKEDFSIGIGYGNMMGLTTAIFFALYAVIIRGKRQTDMLPTLLVSSVAIMLATTILNGADLKISLYDLTLCLIWGGLLSGVANFLFISASRYLAAAEVTLFMMLEFALGPIWVWWFVREVPTKWTVVGGIMIFAAVAILAAVEIATKPRKQQTISDPV